MCTLESICWGVLVALMAILLAGIVFMVWSSPDAEVETDFDVAEADLAELRAASRR